MTAPFLALVLLSFASVQSLVMRAVLPSEGMTPICGAAPVEGAMPAMAMDNSASFATASHAHVHGSSRGRKASCPYCAAAAHAPITGQTPPLRFANGFVFATYQVVASLGPRGPPTVQPRARGPPVPHLTA